MAPQSGALDRLFLSLSGNLLELVSQAGTLRLGFLSPQLQNGLSRFFEEQCDRFALLRTRQPDAYRSAFTKLAQMNKADLDPHPFVVWLFDDHPAIRQRLLMADSVYVE